MKLQRRQTAAIYASKYINKIVLTSLTKYKNALNNKSYITRTGQAIYEFPDVVVVFQTVFHI